MRIAGFTVQYSRDHQYSRFFVRHSGYPVSFNWTSLGSEAGKPDMSTVCVQQDTLSGATADDLVRRATPVVSIIERLLWLFLLPCLPGILVV